MILQDLTLGQVFVYFNEETEISIFRNGSASFNVFYWENNTDVFTRYDVKSTYEAIEIAQERIEENNL